MYFKNLEAFINDTAISVTAQKMFSIKDFFSKCDQIRSFLWILSHLVTFAEEILNGKLHFFLCSEWLLYYHQPDFLLSLLSEI